MEEKKTTVIISGKTYTVQCNKDMSQEREFIENILNIRFGFFITIISIVIGGAFNVGNPVSKQIILSSGAIISWLIALTLFRAQQKLDIILDKLLPDDHPAKIVDAIATGRSRRKIIGYILPFGCSLFITILSLLSYLEN